MLSALFLAITVSSTDAMCAVRGWTRDGGTLAAVGSPISATEHHTGRGNSFYSVRTTRGTVFVAGDTGGEPIIAFAGNGANLAQVDEGSPLAALLENDRRLCRGGGLAKWNRLLAKGQPATTLFSIATGEGFGTDSIGDMRVPALVQSNWGQEQAWDSESLFSTPMLVDCFNLHTPSNACCGCVATAMGQVMRLHRHPASIGEIVRECYINGKAESLATQSGTYDWDSIPCDVETDGVTPEQAAALGRVTYNAAVSVRMNWWYGTFENDFYDSGSTYGFMAAKSFGEVFGYASATYFDSLNGTNTHFGSGMDMLVTNNLERVVFSNLDAGYPVLLGLEGGEGEYAYGHSVVCDGYGYKDGNAYVHLNMGWYGQCDLWYLLPDIDTRAYTRAYFFDSMVDAVYNIIPGDTVKGTLSGRVTRGGNGVADASVSLYKGGTKVAVSKTNAYGVYGFAVAEAGEYRVVAESSIYGGETPDPAPLALPDAKYVAYDKDDNGYSCSRVVWFADKTGNSWGNDIELDEVSVPAVDANGGEVSIPAGWFTNYYESAASGSATVSDLAAIAAQPAANGVNTVGECYVALLDPTNATDRFKAEISFNDVGDPVITWTPKDETTRDYTLYSSDDLQNWTALPAASTGLFFKVQVRLK